MQQADDWDFLRFRAQHGGLVKVESTISHTATGRRSKLSHLQSVADARLIAALDHEQQHAAERLMKAIKAVSGQLDFKPPVWERRDKGHGGGGEEKADLSALYWRFLEGCERDRIDCRPALMICGHGWSVRKCEQRYNQGRRRVMQSLRDALDVMAAL